MVTFYSDWPEFEVTRKGAVGSVVQWGAFCPLRDGC